MFKGLGVTIAR